MEQTPDFKEIHVVSNTHWDREFRYSFQQTRMMLVKMMDYLLELLERDDSYISYTMDAHCIMIEDYLEARPQNRNRIENLVKSRRLLIGPWYSLPDIPNISQESIIRNLQYGHKVSQSFGHVMKIGYTPCSWGQTGQLPQIFNGFGIDTALFYRGISPHETKSEFIWKSPDGSQVLAHRFALFARYNYYYLVFRKITYGLDINDRTWRWGETGETPFKNADADSVFTNVELLEPDVLYIKENLKPAFDEMLRLEGGQYSSPYFLAMHGHDISWPHPLEPQVVKDANEQMGEIKVIFSDLEKFFQTLKKNLDLSKLTILIGERRTNLRDGWWTYLLPGTISARTRLKQENFRTEMMLIHQAEPASVLAWQIGLEYPERYLDMAWRHLLCTHTHDANAGCAPDDVIEDVRYHLRQTRQISEGLVQDAMKFLAQNVNTGEVKNNAQLLMLFNPLPFERTEILETLIDVPEESGAQSLIIRDPNGGICDYQIISETQEGIFVDNQWNVPQAFLSRRFRIKLSADKIPSLGYKVYTIETSAKPDRKTGTLFTSPNEMENEFLKVTANGNGTLTVLDKETGELFQNLLLLEDAGEAGNAWRRIAPTFDRVIYSSGAQAQISKVEDGVLSATIKIDLTLRVPSHCPDATKRSSDLVDLPITHLITLKKKARHIELTTAFNNTARDHRLRMLFPAQMLRSRVSYADSHFDIVERSIDLPDCKDWKEPVVGTYPYRSFVDMSDGQRGLAILTEGLQEFEILPDKHTTIAITLVRAARIKLEVSEQRKQELPDIGPQCPGRHEFRMAIYPHKENWAEAECPKAALRLNVPLRAAQFGKNKNGKMPLAFSFVKCSNNKIEVSAFKKAENSKYILVRLYNPTQENQQGSIELTGKIKKVWQTNLNEEIESEIKKTDENRFPIYLKPKKIQTILFEI